MAQSIYVTLESLNTETSVPEVKDKDGKVIRRNMGSISHTLPRKNYPTPEQFDNEEMLLAWTKEQGALHSILQAGISDWLIADRATFKQMVKGSWSPETGQEAVNSRKWTVTSRPENAKTDQQKAVEALGKLTPEQIAAILAAMTK